MKYDDLYPDSPPMFEANDFMKKVYDDKVGNDCVMCGEWCRWWHAVHWKHLCSQECLRRFTEMN